jgi:hypothetical protein
MKIPSLEDIVKSMDIRIRSKKGERVTQAEHDFNVQIYKKYPEWYSLTEKEVFERSKPFGS